MAVKLKPVSTIIMDLGLEEYGEAHNYFAERCKERMNARYVPEDTKTLINTSYVDGQCRIVYNQEYASYQYYGQREDGTHKVSHYSKPGTGPYWDINMTSVESGDLLKDMKDYFKER